MKRQLLAAAIMTIGLVACLSPKEVAPPGVGPGLSPAATRITQPTTSTPLPPTRPAPADAATARPKPTTVATPGPISESSLTPFEALPSETPPSETLLPSFQQASSFPGNHIRQLWIGPDGALWVLTDEALYAYRDEAWETLSFASPVVILGNDDRGRVWALFDEGKTIAYYSNEGDWISYGAESGWSAAPPDSYGGQVAIDHNGGVWIALGRNGLRFLNPYTKQWSDLRAGHIGFDRPPENDAANDINYDENLAFLDVATDESGRVWVSACTVRLFHEDSPLPVQLGDGQGVRYFDGIQWGGPNETTDRCVYDLAIDQLGQIWLAGPENDLWTGANNFLRHDPAADAWTPIAVPESLEMFEENPRFARSIWFDDQNRPWLIVARRGGATFPPDAVYYGDQGNWTPFWELLSGRLVLGPENQIWLLLLEPVPYQDRLLSGIILMDDGFPQEINLPVGLTDPSTLTIDGQGRAWLTGRDEASLWTFNPN